MTINRRLFYSNIRIVFITAGSLLFATYVARQIIMRPLIDRENIRRFQDYQYVDIRMTLPLLVIVLFIIIISLVNNYLTHRMTKYIVKPLEPLGEGVRQIRDNNFSYRIDYQNDDEFRPVCDAFNEMAAKLEASTEQQKKDEANRRELIAGISHDLRTPLTSIKGYIEGIETGVASTPEMQVNYLATVKRKAAEIEHIIEQLFLFSKLDMDEFPLNLRCIDLTLAVTDMIEDSISEYASRGLIIKFSEMPKNVFVNADVLLLRNVIVNVLENSVMYKVKECGQMEIGATTVNNSVVLRLTDDGPGVQADMLSKMFNVFYRSDPSRSKQGSGLGLAISVKIIERMDGSMQAELPASGGLAIVIRLPIVQRNGIHEK